MIKAPTIKEILRIGGRKLFGRDFDAFVAAFNSRAQLGFVYDVTQLRGGREIDHEFVHNIFPLEGIHQLLNAGYRNSGAVAQWFMGVFSGDYNPVTGDTMAAFVAAATEVTQYASGTRPLITFSAPAAGNINNTAARCSFVANHPSGQATWRGGFISSNSAKSATTGTLASAARFASDKILDPDDTLLVGASLTMTS